MSIIPRESGPFFFSGGETGCLLVHGFTGAPGEMRLLGERLAERGYTVSGIRLAGHGTCPEDMLKTNWADWYRSVEEGYLELQSRCREIFMVGLSMGGLLSLHASLKYPVAGVVTINSPVYLFNKKVFGQTLVKLCKKFSPNSVHKGENDENCSVPVSYYRFSPSTVPFYCIASLFKLISTVKKELPLVTVPALIIQSKRDEVVNPRSALFICNRLGSADKELLWLVKGSHIATLSPAREEVFGQVLNFLDLRTKAAHD